MCVICKGLSKGSLSLEDAREKYEEFVDLDLIDEDHMEEVETLIAEKEEEENYWSSAKKDYLQRREDYVDEPDEEDIEDESYEDDYLDEEDED